MSNDFQAMADLVDQLMMAKMELMDSAIKSCLIHVPSDEMTMAHDIDSGNDYLVARGVRVYQLSQSTIDLEISVSGEWLVWPPPERRIGWGDIDIINAPMFGD